jgi:hypothetical protein
MTLKPQTRRCVTISGPDTNVCDDDTAQVPAFEGGGYQDAWFDGWKCVGMCHIILSHIYAGVADVGVGIGIRGAIAVGHTVPPRALVRTCQKLELKVRTWTLAAKRTATDSTLANNLGW